MWEKHDNCVISLETSNHSRRCFMTGEYCSKQRNVQQEREKLHSEKKIKAFIVMNFSDMSEVVYKWRISSYVESLKKYLYINNKTKELYCSISDYKNMPDDSEWKQVEAIQIVRSDSDPSSNYVICNRICQQMQMADIVIVDVSRKNPNVFYELGMAVSLGKLILPICYSESYYMMSVPEGVKNQKKGGKSLEHHIGCYPWRKSLFEYYGIRYKEHLNSGSVSDETKYIGYNDATKEEYGFSDVQYRRFPYHEKYGEENIGKVIYDKLSASYNQAEDTDNTLVLYTMEKFVNEEQSGRCMVNFYHNITKKMFEEQCFCGERVGVLVQGSFIPEGDKDTKRQSNLFYGIGDVIQIGLNQATYYSTEQKIKPKDYISLSKVKSPECEETLAKQNKNSMENIQRYVKEYVRNRGLLVYPNTPIFVNRAKNHFYKELFNTEKKSEFCLFYVMLKTLCYTNEIVVDISHNYENCLQSLFWLGAAHGSDVYAITVLHEATEEERKAIGESSEKKARNIFDVAGLWMAILHSNDIEGFYKQLQLAQQGVENHSKLVLADRKEYDKKLCEEFASQDQDNFLTQAKNMYQQKEIEEKQAMESYYRNHFWKNMLRYNQLHIYLPQENGTTEDKEPKAYMVRWDFDAVSELSNYLSKRKPIGEYRILAIEDYSKINMDENVIKENQRRNFISVGEGAKPLATSMAEYIAQEISDKETYCSKGLPYKKENIPKSCPKGECYRVYKGFRSMDSRRGIYTQHVDMKCLKCNLSKTGKERVIKQLNVLREYECVLKGKEQLTQITQLILWREKCENADTDDRFHVSIVGSSGPATLGGTLLFVDEEQKQRYLEGRKNVNHKKEFLTDLQEEVRKEFMNVFMNRLMERVRDVKLSGAGINQPSSESHKESYYYLLECAVRAYLSTVLYRYFLPFLSARDIKRIHNGVRAFMLHMKASGESPFALDYKDKETSRESVVSNENVEEVMDIISTELLSVLVGFKGLEVFYTVRVQNGEIVKNTDKMKDGRSIKDIQMDQGYKGKKVNCIFVFEN